MSDNRSDIEAEVEVVSSDQVDFEMDKAPATGLGRRIKDYRERIAAKKAEEERKRKEREERNKKMLPIYFLVLILMIVGLYVMGKVDDHKAATADYRKISADDIYGLKSGDYIELQARGYEMPSLSSQDPDSPNLYLVILDSEGKNSKFGIELEDYYRQVPDECTENFNRYVYATTDKERKELVFTLRGRFDSIEEASWDWSLKQRLAFLSDPEIIRIDRETETKAKTSKTTPAPEASNENTQ